MDEAAYDFSVLPEPVVLEEGPVAVTLKDWRFDGTAQIRLKALPKPGIELLARLTGLDDQQRISLCLGHTDPGLSFDGREIPGFKVGAETEGPDVLLRWCPRQLPLSLESTGHQLSRVVAHLFGFFPLQRLHAGRLELDDGQWQFVLTQRNDAQETWREIRADGNCRLTHVIEASRKDGSSFPQEDAEDCLEVLRQFLTFVRGNWCEPSCIVGYDEAGQRTWRAMSSPWIPDTAIRSWFDHFHPEQMQALFPLFSARWRSSKQWRECFEDVIYWYANANTAGRMPSVDVSVLVAQAALERLSYQYAVEEKRLISRDGFKSPQLRASDKLRLLLSSVGVPIGVPASLQAMSRHKERLKWTDGPHAFSEIRNALVHPDAKNENEIFECIPDAWKLGLSYVELAMLAVCGYQGEYGNRLTQRAYGQVELVPWRR